MAARTQGGDAARLAGELVRRDSAEANEAAVADVVQPRLAGAGLTVRRHELVAGRAGLVAVGAAPPRLVLTGHLDTVPAEAARWSFDPWSGEVVDGVVRGRGATDMKGGVAAVVTAVEALAAREALPPDVAVVLTAGEEACCEGARAMVDSPAFAPLRAGGSPPGLVVAEPTGLAVRRGHRGVVWVDVRAEGLAAHASAPELGDSAIRPLAAGVARLPLIDPTLSHPLFGSVTWNVGTFRGGTRRNVVADHAAVGLDVRTVPGVGAEHVRARAREAFGDAVDIAVLAELDPVLTAESDPLVGRVAALAGHTAHGPPPGVATFYTDASVLAGALDGAPAVICGPGLPEQVHAIDEMCPVEHIERAARLYAALASGADRAAPH